jgi:hypothetical protein
MPIEYIAAYLNISLLFGDGTTSAAKSATGAEANTNDLATAARSNMCRYAVVYTFGGVYLDIRAGVTRCTFVVSNY